MLKLNNLKPQFDYSEENKYLILLLRKKENTFKEIYCDWFDFNHGGKVEWLLIREYHPNSNKDNIKKYTNHKLQNIQGCVKVVEIIR